MVDAFVPVPLSAVPREAIVATGRAPNAVAEDQLYAVVWRTASMPVDASAVFAVREKTHAAFAVK